MYSYAAFISITCCIQKTVFLQEFAHTLPRGRSRIRIYWPPTPPPPPGGPRGGGGRGGQMMQCCTTQIWHSFSGIKKTVGASPVLKKVAQLGGGGPFALPLDPPMLLEQMFPENSHQTVAWIVPKRLPISCKLMINYNFCKKIL